MDFLSGMGPSATRTKVRHTYRSRRQRANHEPESSHRPKQRGQWSAVPHQLALRCLVRGCCRERRPRPAALHSPSGFQSPPLPRS
jgi:hypothetical protein